jgi:hypothetical protein
LHLGFLIDGKAVVHSRAERKASGTAPGCYS